MTLSQLWMYFILPMCAALTMWLLWLSKIKTISILAFRYYTHFWKLVKPLLLCSVLWAVQCKCAFLPSVDNGTCNLLSCRSLNRSHLYRQCKQVDGYRRSDHNIFWKIWEFYYNWRDVFRYQYCLYCHPCTLNLHEYIICPDSVLPEEKLPPVIFYVEDGSLDNKQCSWTYQCVSEVLYLVWLQTCCKPEDLYNMKTFWCGEMYRWQCQNSQN